MTTAEFNTWYLRFNHVLYGFAMKLTRNEENAKDLMQDTLLRVYANLSHFSDGTNFRAWASTIMRNCFINNYRRLRMRNQVEQPLEDNFNAALSKPVRNNGPSVIMQKELGRMFGKLTDDQRLPFEMYFTGFKYSEIAKRLALPIGTVKSRIFFARKKMKEQIFNNYGTHPAGAQ